MKKQITMVLIIATLLISLFTMTGCSNKNENQNDKNEIKETNNVANKTEDVDNKTEGEEEKNTTTQQEKTENTTKPIDKTPIDINDSKSYFFVVKGKKYYAGDKISELTSSGFTFNKTGSEKEIPANGYLIGGGSVQNSDKRTVFNITPYNNTNAKIKGAEASIGGFSVDNYGYKYLSGDVEIFGGITIGTAMEDVKTVFGEPSKTTEGTSSNGPTYTYEAKASYRYFIIGFDKDGKVSSIKWQNFNFDNK